MIDSFVSLLNQWARLRFFWRRLRLRIPRDALVLDVGSGNDPHGRADVLCDFDIASERERVGPLRVDRPFVVADIQRLPFRDGAFDYAICSHVIEHTERPEQALAELCRVGHAGYIETPSSLGEKLGGFVFHRWLCDVDDGVLVFKRKPRPVFDEQLHFTFHRLWRRNAAYMFFYWQNIDLYYICLEWQGQIPFRIVEVDAMGDWPADPHAPLDLEVLRNSLHPTAPNLKWRTKRLLYRLAGQWHPHRRIDLQALLACPLCRGSLELGHDSARCSACEARFPVCNGIPVLLAEALQPSESRTEAAPG